MGGQKKIKMGELIAFYESLGFKNVKTYVQSGNVLFNSPERDIKKLSKLIEENSKQLFTLSIPVVLKTAGELKQIINANPFIKGKGTIPQNFT